MSETGRRAVARVFAAELARLDPGALLDGAPVSPTGALCPRIFAVGLLTAVEREGGTYRGRLADLTGELVLEATAQEPSAALFLGNAQPPLLVGATARWGRGGWTLETVLPSTEAARSRWVVETAGHTLARIEEVREALSTPRRRRAGEAEGSGVEAAIRHYRPSLSLLDDLEREATAAIRVVAGEPDPEGLLLDLLRRLDAGSGVAREVLLQEAARAGIPRGTSERALGSLLEEGRCFEPQTGVVRKI